jgi:O-antigen/teichoic acid export membrane protein
MWLRATRLVAAISMPALVGLCIVADEFVEVVLGSKWAEAAPVIQVLAWVGIVQSLQTLSGEVLLAVNRSGTLLRYTVLWFVGTVVALTIGLQWGILGVAACYLALSVLIEPLLTYFAARAVGISVIRFAGALSGVAQATALMAAALLLLRAALVTVGASDVAILVLLIVAGTAVYAVASMWRAPEVTDELRAVFQRRQRRSPARVTASASLGTSSDDS